MGEQLKELLYVHLPEADAQVSNLTVHDASAAEARQFMRDWTKPRVEVAVRLDGATQGESLGLSGRREL